MQQVPRWSVTEVCEWVDSLGEPLKDYRDVFDSHAVDGEVLCEMTEDKLKDLGIAAPDHRHEMMKAIAHCRSLIPAEPAEPVLPQAVPAAAPAAGGDDDGEQLCKHLANLKLDNKPAELKKAELVGGGAAAKAPKSLLAIEVFAGSHPVGRHIQHLQAQQQQAPYTLAAYAAIEVRQPHGDKYRVPEAAALGLTAEHHLSLHARVEDDAAREKLLSFVRSELKTSRLDAVVMFGGPPCEMYSNAGPQYRKELKALNEAQASYDSALRQLQQLQKPAKAAGEPVLNGGLADAEQRLQQAQQNLESAKAPVVKHKLGVVAADATVASFLSLYQEIQQECKASDQTLCHCVMENPYSSADKALWNRPFMKETHLINLPNAPKAAEVVRQEGFKASSTAWLNTVWQNWCTYGIQYPEKPTIIFTTLSRTALPPRHCRSKQSDCKVPGPLKGKKHPTIVVNQKEYESAQWPIEFVGAVMRACVGEEAYAGL